MDRSVKVQQNSASARSGIGCIASRVPFFDHPAKEKSSEAEKEARTMRRISANRESARQTIRRRQAIRDELAKKVAELSFENESMKMEKEMAMEEYLSLKDKTKQLKEQMANSTRCKIGGEQNTWLYPVTFPVVQGSTINLHTAWRPCTMAHALQEEESLLWFEDQPDYS